MKTLLNNYKESLAKVDEIETAYEKNPEDSSLEIAFDSAYNNYFCDYITLAQAIVNYTNGRITLNTAKTMIKTRLNDLEKIIELA